MKVQTTILVVALMATTLKASSAEDLHNAARGNDASVIQRLVKDGISVDAPTSRGFTPLILACYAGSEEAVTQLLKLGANINATEWTGSNALMAASFKGHKQIVQRLLKAGAKVAFAGSGLACSRSWSRRERSSRPSPCRSYRRRD